jgi:1-deoxy-D-xylulose-5-phosphate reductoisomerase
MAVKKIAIFGSTGSIGKQALEVISQYRNEFQIALLTGYTNADLLLSQALEHNAERISTPSEEAAERIKRDAAGSKLLISWKEAVELIKSDEVDMVLNSIVGAAGLKISIATILARKKLLLANKESLVIGGEFLSNSLPYWRDYTIPVDSEHSAIFQALLGENPKTINQIILTASGGPFKNLSLEELEKVNPEEALKHPTWSMGKKITVDSATLMNKGLEVIEAHHLFNVPYERIKVVIHPQSIVHGMVLFADGTIKAIMSKPDMRLPIEYAIFFPERREQLIEPLEYSSMSLSFERPDMEKFPALRLAYEAGKRGGNMPVVLNAANEIAVSAFLKGKIKFTDIPLLIKRTLDSFSWTKVETLKDIVETDTIARKKAVEIVKEMLTGS